MTGITINAVVNVPPDSLMVGIGLGLRVAVCTRENGVVICIRMARGANTIRAAMVHREICVIKRGIQPRSRVVAGLARGRESSGNVIGIVGSLIVRLMAPVTSCRQGRVVVVHMALGTGNVDVETSQRERRQVVIKRRLQPRSRVVAHLARVRKTDRHVRWIFRRIVFRHVASRTGRVIQVVVAIDVTLRARCGHVHSG